MTTPKLEIGARLARKRFALKERVGLTLSLVNRESGMVYVPDPIHSTALHLVLRAPDGSEQVVTPGSVVEPGTVPQVVNAGLPPGRSWVQEIDASAFIPMTAKTTGKLRMEKDAASGRDVGRAFQAVLPGLIITGRRPPGCEWLA